MERTFNIPRSILQWLVAGDHFAAPLSLLWVHFVHLTWTSWSNICVNLPIPSKLLGENEGGTTSHGSSTGSLLRPIGSTRLDFEIKRKRYMCVFLRRSDLFDLFILARPQCSITRAMCPSTSVFLSTHTCKQAALLLDVRCRTVKW